MADEESGEQKEPDSKTAEIIEKIEPYLRPDKRAEGRRVVSAAVRKIHVGPLPPPEDLAAYDQIIPGCAERILSMAEANMRHRHGMSVKGRDGDLLLKKRGQLFAIVALILMLFVVGFAIWLNEPWVAGILGGATITAITGLFLAQQRAGEQAPIESERSAARPSRRR